MSAIYYRLQSTSQLNYYSIYVSYIMSFRVHLGLNCYLIHMSCILLLAKCTLPNRYLFYVSHILLLIEYILAKLLPELCQPHDVAQSTSQLNCCLIYVSHILLLTKCTLLNQYLIHVNCKLLLIEYILAKLLLDLCQLYNVI